ncbi:MAG: hypothetical protein WCR72_18010 [Bacteroidota bacterium]
MERKIGEIIEEHVRLSKIDIVEFARAINKERSNVYNIFKRESIDTDLLKKIGQVLKYDFFQDFLEDDTIQKIKVSETVKKAKVLIEIEISEDEKMRIGFEKKILEILNK